MDPKERVSYLLTTKAIREQCGRLLQLAEAGRLNHFHYHAEKLPIATDFVLQHIRENYPDLAVPYHSRWRHFDAKRLDALDKRLSGVSREERARSKMELAIVSVLLDAGAGMAWRYRDAAGHEWKMSEGLAAASFDMFLSGAFSSDPTKGLQIDPEGLKSLNEDRLGSAFQVSATNPLQGFTGRLKLLHSLGQALELKPSIFALPNPRLGHIFDFIASRAEGQTIAAREILSSVLEGLGSIWPGRVSLGGVNLGDVWSHSLLPKDDLGSGLVPFHKLSQWLSYSLAEPLEEAGYTIAGLDELTGLAEYRNGGLFVDLGVLSLKDPNAAAVAHSPESELIVEWRALTLSLLDRLADEIREKLHLSSSELPLAKILQGGTWSAGRRIAASKRADGGPPLRIASDGTVF